MINAIVVALLLSQISPGSRIRSVPGKIASSRVASMSLFAPFNSSGPLLDDDVGTVVHVVWDGSALVNTVGPAWTQNGVVPQNTPTPLYPNGFSNPSRKGAGPFTTAINYSLGSGSDVLDFAGDFTVCVAFVGVNATASVYLFDTNGAGAGWSMTSGATFNYGAGSLNATSTAIVTNGINIMCAGRGGSSIFSTLNMSGTATAAAPAYTVDTTTPARIGASGATGMTGWIVEVWASTTPSSVDVHAQIMKHFFGHQLPSNQALTVVRAVPTKDFDKIEINGVVWDVPPGAIRVNENGMLLEPARTNIVGPSSTFGGWGTIAGGGAASPVQTSNFAAAPDGIASITAARITFPAISGVQQSSLHQAVTLTAVPWTYSVWLRATAGAGPGTIYMFAFPNAGHTPCTTTLCSFTESAWTICTITFTATAAVWIADIGVDKTAASAACAHADHAATSMIASGGQLEAGTYRSTLVTTTLGATSTRAVDNVTIAPNPFTNRTRWCASGTFTPENGRAWSAVATAAIVAAGTDGGGNSWRILEPAGPNFDLTSRNTANGTRTLTIPNPVAAGTGAIVSFGNTGNNNPHVEINGSVAGASLTGAGTTSFSNPTNALRFGATSALGTSLFGGWIRDFYIRTDLELCPATP